MDDLRVFYIGLRNGLHGYYIKVMAKDEAAATAYADKYVGLISGGVYSEAYFYEILRRRFPASTKIINKSKPVMLINGQYE